MRIYHLDRGYEALEEKLLALGAHVLRVGEEERVPLGEVRARLASRAAGLAAS